MEYRSDKKGITSEGKRIDSQRRLEGWKERLSKSLSSYSTRLSEFDERERLYLGEKNINKIVEGDRTKETKQVRNVVSELIESEVDSSIPMPKVTAVNREDEHLARKIENMLRGELDRLPFERMNDMAERTVPLQGGAFWLIEWDSAERTHSTMGDVAVSFIHPKKVVPQSGIYEVPDMDYFFIRQSLTKKYVKRRWGVEVFVESESDPELKTLDTETDQSDELVTVNTAYYKNSSGGIGQFIWCNNTVLADFEDYQKRKDKKEEKEGEYSFSDKDGEILAHDKPIVIDTQTMRIIPKGTKIPYYVPNVFPVVLQKNVSLYGTLLGDSDADKVADQQNILKRLSQKINEKIMKSGSYMSLPEDAKIKIDSDEMKVIRLRNPSDKSMIDVYNMEAGIGQDLNWYQNTYEESRQALGITNSFQGRYDSASESGVAKKLAIAQSAGRLESKKIMKNAAYADIFELIFKYKLAYADEKRPIVSIDYKGQKVYEEFDRYEFLKKDESGEWYWEDRFLFDVDTSAVYANNREYMWQELRENFQGGTFGDPTDIQTLILFWEKMEENHYPGAASVKKYFENRAAEAAAAAVQGEPGAVPR